jgi:thiol:disulfide interchange protein DsbD
MRALLFIAFVLTAAGVNAQSGSAKQVSWSSTVRKLSANVVEVRLTATINGDYHLYAQAAGVDGPVATTFSFNPNPLLTLNGKVKEAGKLIQKYEEAWEGNVNYYEKKVDFIQQVTIKGKAKTALAGKVEFMVCNETQCLPPAEYSFRVALGG